MGGRGGFFNDDLLALQLVEDVLDGGEARSELFVDGGVLGEECGDAVALLLQRVQLVAERPDRPHQNAVLSSATPTFLISSSRSCFNYPVISWIATS